MPDAVPALIAALPPAAGPAQTVQADPGATGFPQFLAALLGTGDGAPQPSPPGQMPEPSGAADEAALPGQRELPARSGTAKPAASEPRRALGPASSLTRDTAAKDKPASDNEAGRAPDPTAAPAPAPLPAMPPPASAASQLDPAPPSSHEAVAASTAAPPAKSADPAALSPRPLADDWVPKPPAGELAAPSPGPAWPGPEAATAAAAASPRPAEPAAPPPASGAPAPAGHAAAPPPAAQVAAPLFALSQREDGAQRISLRLEPAELGQVEIRIDRAANAPAHVEIAVERPETMTLLLRDQAQLQHTLDRAGVPAEGRTLDIHLAAPDPNPSLPSFSSGSGTDAGPTGGGSGTPQRHSPQPGRQDQTAQEQQPSSDRAPLRWLRPGLDITA